MTSRLRAGEAVAAAGGVALLIVMFLDWYGVRGRDEELSAWSAFTVIDVILLLVALAAIALAVLQVTQRAPALPVAASVVTTTAGIVAALLVLYRIVDQPGPNDFIEVRPGAWLGLVAVAVVVAGGWRSMDDEDAAGAERRAPAVERRPAPPA